MSVLRTAKPLSGLPGSTKPFPGLSGSAKPSLGRESVGPALPAELELGAPGNVKPLSGLPGNAKPPLGRESVGPAPPAELGLGAPRNARSSLDPAHRGWYSRGYLPHCDYPGLLQSITYRLIDSLPAAVLEQIDADLRNWPPERQTLERRKRIEAWLDAGHGCCVLREPEAAACVVDTWQHFAGKRYDLIAWVVMPNHVHLLIRTYKGIPLGKIVQSWKSYTSRWIRRMMEDKGRGEELPVRGLWMREYWDRYIRNERHFRAVVAYIHENPVKAGLVGRAEDWPWSSAREHAETAELGLGDPMSAEPVPAEPGNAKRQLGNPVSVAPGNARPQPGPVGKSLQ